ncbi:Retrovirus-related Pol polyprotein LINE-1 [Cricetulus griseus]|uniref:Retrovirus-related Pol polyprotein LINE-1 n=1 Tax=Cricetulus griseus TaxID=10029 RepID=G3HGV2_CRIGR|nr:Retrovirus-related Pol polyprotein LINE-1 [Cricetulus griseus]
MLGTYRNLIAIGACAEQGGKIDPSSKDDDKERNELHVLLTHYTSNDLNNSSVTIPKKKKTSNQKAQEEYEWIQAKRGAKKFSKWIKNLNINPATLNLLEEKVGGTLKRIGIGDGFLNITPVSQTLRSTINKWDLQKLRSFCKAKDTVNKTKWQSTEWAL